MLLCTLLKFCLSCMSMKFFSMYLEIELGFPSVKEYVCRAGDLGLIPGLGRSPGEENGYPFSCLDCYSCQRSLVGLQSLRSQRVGND